MKISSKSILFHTITIVYVLLDRCPSEVNARPGAGLLFAAAALSAGSGSSPAPEPSPEPAPESEPEPEPAPEPSPPPPPPPVPPGVGAGLLLSGVTPPPVCPTVIAPTPSISKKVPLTIYYDAMEQNSQIFFNSTFHKEFPYFSNIIDLNLVPCQLVEVKPEGISCSYQADTSCSVDVMQSCAINQMTDKTQLAGFLACTMSSVDKIPNFANCASQAKYDDKKLQNCADSDTGKNLCKTFHDKCSPGDKAELPKMLFKNQTDIKDGDTFEHLDDYTNQLLVTNFQATVCAKLKTMDISGLPEECNKKLILGVFYKAMDDTSKKWIQALGQIYDQFSDYLIIKYEPCMFAEFTEDGKIDCKDDGDPDCVAAKTHACAATLIKDQKSLFHFMKCVTQNSTNMPDFQKCATDNKIQYDPIKSCADGDLGKNLCFVYSQTRLNTDKIPSFSYELTFDEKLSDDTAAATDLKSVICGQLKKYSILNPTVCS